MTTPRQFMALWNPRTLLSISSACLQDPRLNLWVMQLVAAQEVNITDPDTRGGIEAMVAAGLTTREEADAVVAALSADLPPVRTVASTDYALGQSQEDGRFYATLRFALTDGAVQTAVVLCEAGTDVDALIAQQAAVLNASLMRAARG